MGSTTALSYMTWQCLKAQRVIATGELQFATKAVLTGFGHHFIAKDPMNMLTMNKSTAASIPVAMKPAGLQIHHFSYLLVGAPICIIVSLIASYVIVPTKPCELNPAHW